MSDGERCGGSAEDVDPVFFRFLKISSNFRISIRHALAPSGGRIVFASRILSRPLRLGHLGSGAWRLGDLQALFLGVLGRLPPSLCFSVAQSDDADGLYLLFGQIAVLSSIFGLGGPKVKYCRQFLAWMALKCSIVVNSWRGWPYSAILSSILGLDGPEVQYCRQCLAWVARK